MNRTIFTILFALLCIPLSLEARKKVKAEEVPQLLNYPSADMNTLPLHGGEVVIKGHVVAEDAKNIDELNGSVYVLLRNYLVANEETILIDFKSDGTFSLNLQVPYPMFVEVYPLTDIYACPGDTLELTIDTTKPSWQDEGVSVSGTGISGEVSERYEQIRKAYFDKDFGYYEIEDEEEILKWKDIQVAQMDDLVRKMNAGLPELEGCSPMASDILRTRIISENTERILDAIFADVPDDEAVWKSYVDFLVPRERYMLDNPLMMIAADEFFFNRVEICLMSPLMTSLSPTNFSKVILNGLHDKLNLSTTDFSLQVSVLRFLTTMLDFFGRASDTAKDNEVEMVANQAAEVVANTLSDITHPELTRQAVLLYHNYVKKNELPVGEARPVTKGDSIFQRIIEPYKGNVLYVDFWEEHCGPCRAKMLEMRDEVEANKDKPVKYLYITDDPKVMCRHFLEPNNIKGEHIFITKSEWGYLQAKFQFTSIPFVVLFDKKGNQRDNTTVEELLKE